MDRIKYLLLQFLREEITPAEQAELDSWVAEDPANRELMQELQDPDRVAEGLAKLEQLHRREAWQKVESYSAAIRAAKGTAEVDSLLREQRVRRMRWPRYAVAAALIGLVGLGIWWLASTRQTESKPAVVARTKTNDIQAPTRSRATLTLASGQQVDLDSAGTGSIAEQDNLQVVRGKDGKLTYASDRRLTVPGPTDLIYNTVTNPRGSQVVDLTLSDGTHVWLNAESSVRYPVVFMGAERTVEVTGEAYFEVTRNAHQPFIVTVPGRESVTVLGTSFNINAYTDEEALRTTLLEGAIRVHGDNSKGAGLTLLPGNQAVLKKDAPMFIATNANLAAVLAWKNNRFAFNDADLPTVMRQLARWYDIQVDYAGAVPPGTFEGKIGKSLTLDQALKVLTNTRIHYKIDGKKLTILP